MKLAVHRQWFTDKTSIGQLLIADQIFCFTLEDRIRAPGVKVKAETAIAPGLYDLVIDFSDRFQKLMPHVLDVPLFKGIRIHPGNYAVDTDGCLLVGDERVTDAVLHSVKTFDRLFPILIEACKREKVTIEYININPPPHLLA